tara:strand:+ start:2479 stop:3273 length:795 start_codon:yes stop_codon:yes gene_type:complete
MNRKEIIKNFKENGFVLLNKNFSNLKRLNNFTDKFTFKYSNDAKRREKINNFKYLNSVDKGKHAIPLHSESSFTSVWPKAIWFYCKDISKNNSGKTLLCDGLKLWENLSQDTKEYFLSTVFCFDLQIDLNLKNKKRGKKKWFLNKLGFGDTWLDYKKDVLLTKNTKFLVSKEEFSNAYCFVNHLFTCLIKQEEQIIKFYPINKKNIPKAIINEIKTKSEKLTFEHAWKKGDLLFINNRRFLHGRTKINNLSRQIINIQSLEINF